MTKGEEVSADDHRDDERAGGSRGGVRQGPLGLGEGLPAGTAGEPSVRYWLRPSFEPFAASTGDLHLVRPGETQDLVIRAPAEEDLLLLEALGNAALTTAELASALRLPEETIVTKVRDLHAAGVVVACSGENVSIGTRDAERFDRQLPYFAEWGDPGTTQRMLREAKVVVLGCGGLGTWAIGALASTGVGHFVLVDDDVVDLSNLNRQVLYAEADLGLAKAERAAAWIRAFDSTVDVQALRARISCADDVRPLLAGAHALVLAADYPPYELSRWVDDACQAAAVPFITAGQVPPVLKVGPTYVPGRTPSFREHEAAIAARHPLYEEITTERAARPLPATTLGPASGIVGTVLAMEVMHLLIGRHPVATEGRALLIDMRTLDVRWEDSD